MSRPDCYVLDQPAVLRFMFYPRPDFYHDLTDEHDVFFPVAGGIRLGGRLHVAEKSSPVILLFHGNGEIASDYDDFAPAYTQMGVSLLVVDYRGYGKSDGTPTASALLDDAIEIYRHLHNVLSGRGLDNSRVFIMGRSLGSAAALEIASQIGDAVEGVIIESGFASALGLVERVGGSMDDEGLRKGASGFDNAEKIRQVLAPTLIIHGETDQLIPPVNGKTLYDSCGSERKRLVNIPGAGHNDLLYRGQEIYFAAIRELIDGTL